MPRLIVGSIQAALDKAEELSDKHRYPYVVAGHDSGWRVRRSQQGDTPAKFAPKWRSYSGRLDPAPAPYDAPVRPVRLRSAGRPAYDPTELQDIYMVDTYSETVEYLPHRVRAIALTEWWASFGTAHEGVRLPPSARGKALKAAGVRLCVRGGEPVMVNGNPVLAEPLEGCIRYAQELAHLVRRDGVAVTCADVAVKHVRAMRTKAHRRRRRARA